MRKCFISLLISSSALSLLSGCAKTSPSASLTVYSGQHPQLMAKLVAAFEAKTAIPVALRSASEQVLVSQVLAEAGHSPADVVVTENAPAMNALVEHHLLAPLPAEQLARVVKEARGPSRQWLGVSRRVNVLVYDAKRLRPSQLPRSIEELGEPRFRGLLGLAPGESDFSPVVAAYEHVHGQAATLSWLTAMKANAAGHLLPDNEALLSQIALGQIGLATMDQYYWYRFHHDTAQARVKMAAFAPGGTGNIIGVSAAGIMRQAPHAKAARAFLDFLSSAEGQRIVANSGAFEYPTSPSAPTPKGLPPISQYGPSSVSPAVMGSGRSALNLLQAVQLL